jgi:hypothetical protein
MANDLAKKETVTFLVLEKGMEAIQKIKDNLDGEDLNPRDLDRVSIPAGGGFTWCVPTLGGEMNIPEIIGVIVGIKNCRAYWLGDYAGGGEPPSCVSDDNVTGVGDPGGVCHNCPLAEFGSDSRGKGQACKQVKRVFVVPPKSLLPMVVQLPPTSLEPCRKYVTRLGSEFLGYRDVVTRIALSKEKSGDGIAYSKAAFTMEGRLDPAQAAFFEKYAIKLGLKEDSSSTN